MALITYSIKTDPSPKKTLQSLICSVYQGASQHDGIPERCRLALPANGDGHE